VPSANRPWGGGARFETGPGEGLAAEEHRVQMEVRRFLRAAVFGSYEFDATRFARARREHHERVERHFAARPGDLLTLDIVGGERWERLADFLGVEIPTHPFPHKGKKLSEKLASLEVDD